VVGLATPVTLAHAPVDAAAKLDCVSYAPLRNDQTPRTPGLIISPEQIAEDLVALASDHLGGRLAWLGKCRRSILARCRLAV